MRKVKYYFKNYIAPILIGYLIVFGLIKVGFEAMMAVGTVIIFLLVLWFIGLFATLLAEVIVEIIRNTK